MNRFWIGLLLGASASAITWVISQSVTWTVIVGLVVAVLVWFGEFILNDLL